MFKRVERKRKRREEEEELGLDQDTREVMGLNDTDPDESDSGSEHESVQSDNLDAAIGEDGDQEGDVASEDESVDGDPPISVAEALKNPIYLISLDPTVHGCVLCKGKLIKNAGMATAHKNAKGHKRRFDHFRLLSAAADPRSNAWELVRAVRSASNEQRVEPQDLSKRALKRQVKQAAIREKRKRHKELKAKAIAKKVSKKLSTADEARPVVPSEMNLRNSPVSQNQPGKTRKKQKTESKTSTRTTTETRDVSAKSASRTKTSSASKRTVLKSKLKSTGKPTNHHNLVGVQYEARRFQRWFLQ